MKYEKTKDDIKKEKQDLEGDSIMIYLRHKDQNQFNVGDILIKLYHHGEGKWVSEKASGFSDAPKKFLYAFENEIGVGYLKQFKTNGQLGDATIPMTSFSLQREKFVLDPDYADHLMLSEGEEFSPIDAFKEQKKFRDRGINRNRKLTMPNAPQDILNWINGLKVGDEFYWGWNIPDMVEKKYKVASFVDHPVRELKSTYDIERINTEFGLGRSATVRTVTLEIIKHPWSKPGEKNQYNARDFLKHVWTHKEVFPLSDSK